MEAATRSGDFRARRAARTAAFVLAVVAVQFADAQQRTGEEADLARVRKEIGAVEKRVAEQATRRNADARKLRAAELEVAEASRRLEATRARQRVGQGDQGRVTEAAAAARARLARQRDALATQARLRYMTGNQEVFRLLLNQESPADLGRMLAYYDYYNRARGAEIAAAAAELEEIVALDREAARIGGELAALEQRQAGELAALARARDERAAVLGALDAGIAGDNVALARLREEETRLKDLVAELTALMADLPTGSAEPFAGSKGRLAWPVNGRVAGDYGQPRDAGRTRWDGLLLEAERGAPVRAVHRGRVAFAEWTRAHGLLIMVNHGDGYMSLYAYNEALLKEEGDWVEAGETIALVGETGGRAQPSLYFEIRRNSEPVNPRDWLGRQPSP